MTYGKRHRTLALLLAALLAALTVQPALADELVCPKEEHTHDESCYNHRLVCELEEREGHQHTEECYLVERDLICSIEEGAVLHEHGEDCYEQRTSCVCSLEEIPADPGHTHGEECYDEAGELICDQTERAPTEGHTHTEDCFVTETVLTCTQSTEPHIHTDECYNVTRTLVCEREEVEGHKHTAACYERVGGPICGKEEHTHSEDQDCYSNPYIDVENMAYWDKMMAELELTGDWATDLLTVAYSQLGYHASIRNFIWNFEGVKVGYSRYGHWYSLYRNTPYREFMYEYWCADFASFCVHYAGIPEDYVPLNKNCANWITALDELGFFVRYQKNEEGEYSYTPVAGDLIFFEYGGDKRSDHVGIVSSVDPDTGEIHTIEGNHGWAVREDKYDPTNWRIYGFGCISKAQEKYKQDQLMQAIKDSATDAGRIPINTTQHEIGKEDPTAARQAIISKRQQVMIMLLDDSPEEEQEELLTEQEKAATPRDRKRMELLDPLLQAE